MIHTFYLLKPWPKSPSKFKDPIIYCREKELDLDEVKKDLDQNYDKNNDYELIEVDGYESAEELIRMKELRDPDFYPKLSKEDIQKLTTPLTFEGKTYYFPQYMLLQNPKTKVFEFLFPKKQEKE